MTVDLVNVEVLGCFDIIVNFMAVIMAMAGYGLGSIIHSVIKVKIYGFNFNELNSHYQKFLICMGFTKHKVYRSLGLNRSLRFLDYEW